MKNVCWKCCLHDSVAPEDCDKDDWVTTNSRGEKVQRPVMANQIIRYCLAVYWAVKEQKRTEEDAEWAEVLNTEPARIINALRSQKPGYTSTVATFLFARYFTILSDL